MAKRALSGSKDITARLITVFKDLISDGILSPGGRLPPERDLAQNFGVSRSSLRQALKVLEIMGVISQRVGDGTYVNAAASSILSEPMNFLILLDGITFHELMEARLIVEPELAGRAAKRATPEDIAELSRVHAAMEESAGNPDRFVEYDLLFHQTLYRIAGNRVCSLMFTVVHQSVHKLMLLTTTLVAPEHTLTLHRRILTAIRKGDSEGARQRMTEHLLDATGLQARAAAHQSEAKLRHRLSRLAAKGPVSGSARMSVRGRRAM
jgi:GntR family transcriptional repressor for pyruvate dehydrogenase complex